MATVPSLNSALSYICDVYLMIFIQQHVKITNSYFLYLPPGGAAGAVSRITGALGKGIATLTLDDDYQKKRREALNKRPANVREGFARGGKGLVMVMNI